MPDSEADVWTPDPHPVGVQAITFEEGGVTISYVEEQDVAVNVMVAKQVMLRWATLRKEDYEDVLDTIRDWIDTGLIYLRQQRGQ